MRSYLFILYFFSLLLLSCGNNDSETDEPIQKTDHPKELVGTWIYYSGTPKSILSDVESGNILNHELALTANGNFSESITAESDNNKDSASPRSGNWKVNNKTLKFTDWYGNPINADISFSLGPDSILVLTCVDNIAYYYKPDDIQKHYSQLIIGTWETYRIKIVVSGDGTGAVYNYYSDYVYGSEKMTWKIEKDSLTINYTDWAYPTSLHKYRINYLNTKHLSWTDNQVEYHFSKRK